MTVRLKILSIAVALLVLSGIVIGISAVLQSELSATLPGSTDTITLGLGDGQFST